MAPPPSWCGAGAGPSAAAPRAPPARRRGGGARKSARAPAERFITVNPVQTSRGQGERSGAGPGGTEPDPTTRGEAEDVPPPTGGCQAQPEGPGGARGPTAPAEPRGRSDVAGLHRQTAAVGAAPGPVGLEAPATGEGRFGGRSVSHGRRLPQGSLQRCSVHQPHCSAERPSRPGLIGFDPFPTAPREALQQAPLQKEAPVLLDTKAQSFDPNFGVIVRLCF